MTRTLVITNDFPPRTGGIQSFVHALTARLPPGGVVVYTSSWPGATEFDAAAPFPVVRDRASLLLPTPRVQRRAREIARAEGCSSVWFGAAAPLGLMAGPLRRADVERLVATTHGHETAWARLPGARRLLRRIGEDTDVVTYLGEYTRARIAPALSPAAAARMRQLPPGVDERLFRPGSGARLRERLGLEGCPVVVCVSRLVPRKGQDTLLRALPEIRSRLPGTVLLLVGGGSYRRRLEALADRLGVRSAVVFAGSVPWGELPAYFGAGDVFAMPCRTRLGGIDVEGLGIVYLEASATGLPVVAGSSGGAPDAVLDGATGYVVDGRSVPATARRVAELLAEPGTAKAMGERGRRWVEERWRWDTLAARLKELLEPPP
ncbi:MAG: glycosyltransferase family 4 protein [Carbonactinosporaceae bacterium]